MMDAMETWEEIDATLLMLDRALAESKKRGNEWAQAKAAYYSAKARCVFALKAQGMAASLIQLVVKGDDAVNRAMLEMDAAEVSYDNAREARNVYKKKLDTLREQLDREWSRAGMN